MKTLTKRLQHTTTINQVNRPSKYDAVSGLTIGSSPGVATNGSMAIMRAQTISPEKSATSPTALVTFLTVEFVLQAIIMVATAAATVLQSLVRRKHSRGAC